MYVMFLLITDGSVQHWLLQFLQTDLDIYVLHDQTAIACDLHESKQDFCSKSGELGLNYWLGYSSLSPNQDPMLIEND